MTTRDTLEMILEALEEVKKTEDMLISLFNKVYYEHLRKSREVEE